MERQYFYLVAHHYDEYTYVDKIFLQEHEAVTWGRKKATECEKYDWQYEYVLYRQLIARTAVLEYVKSLEPYKETSNPNHSGLEFDWSEFDNQGADTDIDLRR